MKLVFVTLFPAMLEGPLQASILGRAAQQGLVDASFVQIRDHATDRHRTVDDTPYGGGQGMVLRPVELGAATLEARARCPGAPVILLSPQGSPLRQTDVRKLATLPGLVMVCGRYEGVDERWVDAHVDIEISLGDFVLTGGELPALCLADAVVRLLPGVLGHPGSVVDESFSLPRLEHPQFTRPAEWGGLPVPAVLTSGDHGRVGRWRLAQAAARTGARRPDLLEAAPLSADERAALREFGEDAGRWSRPRTVDGWFAHPLRG